MKILDSGVRQQFESGAVRDISENKGRCDLLPLDIVGALLDIPEFALLELFKTTKNIQCLAKVIIEFNKTINIDMCTCALEVSKHFENGAKKYGENNWKKGIPLHCFIDSAARHRIKHKRGDTDEAHGRAYLWNLLCAMWTYTNKPELDDVDIDLIKHKK